MTDSARKMGPLDIVLMAAAFLASAAVVAFPLFVVPSFVTMYRDFGTQLPIVTRVVISGPYAIASIGLVVLGALAGTGLVVAGHLGPGRVALLLAIGMGMILCAFVIMGLYLPIFQLAGAMRA